MQWGEALALATVAGDSGSCRTPYLATITSAAEDAFVYALFQGSVTGRDYGYWLGGGDFGTEGVWRWETGPEFGQIFFGPGAPAGAYSNWSAGEPNDNLGNEDALIGGWLGSSRWNDLPGNLTPGQVLRVNGYIVEWGLVPEPGTWAMLIAGFGLVGAALRRQRVAKAEA